LSAIARFASVVSAALVVAAAVCQAGYFVGQKRLLARHDAFALTTYGIIAGTGFLVPFLPDAFRIARVAPAPATWAVVFLGAVPTILGYLGYMYAMTRISATRAATFLYLVPLVSTALARLVAHETVTGGVVVGASLVITGVIIVNARARSMRDVGSRRITRSTTGDAAPSEA